MSSPNQNPPAPYPPPMTAESFSGSSAGSGGNGTNNRQPTKSAFSASPHYSGPFRSRSEGLTSTSPWGGEGEGPGELPLQHHHAVARAPVASGAANESSSKSPTTVGGATIRTSPYTSQIKFCHKSSKIACINCAPPSSAEVGRGAPDPSTATPGDNMEPSSTSTNTNMSSNVNNNPLRARGSKTGPVLLELRSLKVAPSERSEFFTTQIVGISRGNPSLGTSVTSTCLDIVAKYNDPSRSSMVVAATGITTGALCIHSFSSASSGSSNNYHTTSTGGGTSGTVGNNDEGEGIQSSSNIEYYHTPRHHRQASAVACRPTNTNHVAIGLLGSQSAQPATTATRRAPGLAGGTGKSGGDREFCAFVWDIESQSASSSKKHSTPMTKLSHNTAVASMTWLLDGQTLAIGGQTKTIQLYDMRLSGANAPPISAHAHTNGVHGIVVDYQRSHRLATFSRTPGEPVKLWDVRRMDATIGEIKVPTGGLVSACEFSRFESGLLSIAIGDAVHDYDANSGTRPNLMRINRTSCNSGGQTVVDLALYNGGSQEQHTHFDGIYRRRMLTVLADRTICDMAQHTLAPVALSRRDGRLVHALGDTLWIGSTNEGPSSMEKLGVGPDDDISATMMRRARCLHVQRYSMDTSSNIKVLSEEVPDTDTPDGLSTRYSLLRLWSWIDRVENLCNDTVDEYGEEDEIWPAKGLTDSGVWSLLRIEEGDVQDDTIESPSLCCSIYESPARRAALTSCGWAGKFDLANVLSDCESLGEYERSAALAVWHGNIGAGVEALQRAAQIIRAGGTLLGTHEPRPSQYAETLDLIAMCIAGYGGSSESQAQVWRTACASLLRRENLSSENVKSSGIAYLRAMCQFLMNIGVNGGLDQVLGNSKLSLCDRVAFACRFLPQRDLKMFLAKCIDSCQKSGDIEGLVITALSKPGIQIVQAFMDRHADVQTAALVVGRTILPPDWTMERKICSEWVEAYRGLLNSWQMWQSRAMFDVDRAELLRNIKTRSSEGVPAAAAGKGSNSGGRRSAGSLRRPGPRPLDTDILPSIPAQLDARCNYCSTPIGLKRHEGNANQWLSKMKPVLSCCPQCRKPLPRCAICLLSLGALNPYMELTRERGRGGQKNADDLSSLANMPFAEWFTWCMRCKHGGHAHHMVGWFANHETCPVSGCECQCQFDGIQKLSRPALKQNSDEQ